MKYETLLEYAKFPLYHSVRLENVANLLLTDTLMIPKDISGKAARDSRNPNTISFTRDINHPFLQRKNTAILTFDKNKLRHNYKLTPHIGDWIIFRRECRSFDDKCLDFKNKASLDYKYKEAEERVVKSIPNFGKYLMNIMLPKRLYATYYMDFEGQKDAFGMTDDQLEQERRFPGIKYVKAFATKYKLPVIPYKGKSNESVLENMLEEDQVFSSWIDDLTYMPDQEAVLMTLLSGRNYTIYDMEEEMADAWIAADSPGGFWHEYIRDYYQVM